MQNKWELDHIREEDLNVKLGVYDLYSDFEEERSVRFIFLHEDWKFEDYSFAADIAMLRLSSPADFSHRIRPICLGFKEKMIPLIRNIKIGSVHGWGETKFSQHYLNISRKIELPILEMGNCYEKENSIRELSWNESFCAGDIHKNVCPGDSGSGFFVRIGEKQFLRGLVSSAVDKSCSETNVALYTDTTEYQTFIEVGRVYLNNFKKCSFYNVLIVYFVIFHKSKSNIKLLEAKMKHTHSHW